MILNQLKMKIKKYFTIIPCVVLGLIKTAAQDTTATHSADSSMTQPAVVNVQVDTAPVTTAKNNGQVYKIKKGVDIPLVLIGAGWSGYNFTYIYSKDPSTADQVENLDRNDVSAFNRSAIDHYNLNSKHVGDIFFYGSMPLPILLMADSKIRHDAGKVTFLWLETMSVTGLLYTNAVYWHDKYRPYAYNPNVPMEERLRGGAKNSFYAGHVALVASSTFFMAKVYSDYHPHSGINWLLFTIAAGVTATVGYCRYDAGQHFPTDIILGAAQGTLTGILVPHFHKNKPIKEKGLTILPTMMGRNFGMAASYRF
jgi:membrane-associated phospholipid phosphatase